MLGHRASGLPCGSLLEFLPRAAAQAHTLLAEFSPAPFGDDAFVREELTRSIQRVLKHHTGKRPGVLPLVVKL